jgi:hypothetical protein
MIFIQVRVYAAPFFVGAKLTHSFTAALLTAAVAIVGWARALQKRAAGMEPAAG